jgi:hypothetical protein
VFITLLLLSPTTPAQTQTGTVTGVVTDAITHIPVKKVIVTSTPISQVSSYSGTQSAITDASGAFTLTNLPAAKYRLMFQHQNYPQARFGGTVKTVDVKAGESAGPVNVELIPGASISGHVVDEDGDPLQGCFIEIHPMKNPEQGVPMMGSLPSNQDGEWRAFGIAPGKYILSAQCTHQVFQPRAFSAGPDPPPSRAYSPQYYPLAGEAKSAQAVELTAGNEKSGVDFQMSPTPVTQIHGTFSPAGADWRTGGQLAVQLISVAEPSRNRVLGGIPNLEKGTFEFRQVFPGSYVLAVLSQGNDENRVGAWQPVELSEKPLDLTVELKHYIDLAGKVEMENSDNKTALSQLNIQLLPQSVQFGLAGAQTQIADDGTFTLKGVMPAPWRLQLIGPTGFIKSAWLGSTDVTNAPLDLSGGAAGALRIVVSTNMATIRGSAPAGTVVMVQRVDDNTPFHFNRAMGVDQNGQYSLGGLAPGRYRVVATEDGGPMPDDGGQEVTVHEGETVMADLKPDAKL